MLNRFPSLGGSPYAPAPGCRVRGGAGGHHGGGGLSAGSWASCATRPTSTPTEPRLVGPGLIGGGRLLWLQWQPRQNLVGCLAAPSRRWRSSTGDRRPPAGRAVSWPPCSAWPDGRFSGPWSLCSRCTPCSCGVFRRVPKKPC